MKHPATRELYEYWDRQRFGAPAPDRGALEPGAIRHVSGDMFVLGSEPPSRYPLRVAGTRVCALFGRDVKGEDFLQLFAAASRRKLEDFLCFAAEESLATIAGVAAFGRHEPAVHLELLLLPFAPALLAPQSVTGALVALGPATQAVRPPLCDLSLVSWRHAGHRTPKHRAVQRLSLSKGLTVYEGSREDH